MDPFVQLFNTAIDSLSLGVTCLCADDKAIVLRSWSQLVDVYKIFVSRQARRRFDTPAHEIFSSTSERPPLPPHHHMC